jgi:hypothetical protein
VSAAKRPAKAKRKSITVWLFAIANEYNPIGAGVSYVRKGAELQRRSYQRDELHVGPIIRVEVPL